MSQVKYLGLLFHSEAAFSPNFVNLKQNMYGASAVVPVISGPAVPHLHGLCASHGVFWL